MSNLKTYRLRDMSRDYIAIVITAKRAARGYQHLTCIVGSPVVGDWNALLPEARRWVEAHAETLRDEAFNHRVLGVEMRRGCE